MENLRIIHKKKEVFYMKNTKKIAIAGILIALSVVGATFAIPVGASKCSPVQHMVNVMAAVILGPWYGVVMAAITSLIRVMTGLGTWMAFPGSVCGAFLAGLLYKFGKKLPFACIGELFGTGIIGALLAYPVAVFIMGSKDAALFGYVVPFLISSLGGTIIAVLLILALKKTGVLKRMGL